MMPQNNPLQLVLGLVILAAVYYGTNTAFALSHYLFH